MSRKSRRHGRHFSQSKKRKFRKGFAAPAQQSAVAPQPAAVSQRPEPRAEVLPPPAPAPRVATPSAQPVNVTAELRRIGIITGVILVILVALALVLH